MNLPYYLFIALRYFKSKKKNRGLSFNSVISIAGVSVGVMALLVVLSVMSGFHEDLQKKILGANAHVIVMSFNGSFDNYRNVIEQLKTQPHVVAGAPFTLSQVMVTAGKRGHGVFIRGIDPELEKTTTDILKNIKQGSLEEFKKQNDKAFSPIIMGKELANILGLFIGDTVTVISPTTDIGPMGMVPKARHFRLAAIFEMGMFDYDMNLVLIDLKTAQDFFGLGKAVTGIELRLDDIYKADMVRESINNNIGYPFYARDWMQMNRNLFSALKLEKFAMFVILILIVLVASFNIVSTLMMNVMEKQKEIAILKAMGSSNKGVMMIFIFQGLIIGLVGTSIGVIGGFLLGKLLNNYELIKLPADVYYLSKLPVKMKLVDFLVVSISAILISFISTIYPSYYAARINPVEPLRYE
ncbi:MAG: lipoprotein-releasing ABC transporter permease subunit [Thermodesulfovibrionales bacterium]|nr:lipoprotein-releasing ABC transporter permease subunit [Thermodesulfovibrionales bacterium]